MAQPEGHPNPIKIIEHCEIFPPLNSVPTPSSVPLTFLDIPWTAGNSVQNVFFYEFQDSDPNNFVQTILPALKNSISIALAKFYPLAAKIVVPPQPGKPQIIYNEGDSIPFTVAESTADFYKLISNDPQEVQLLHPLVPQLAPWRLANDGTYIISSLLAVQVTLFPSSGMCLGVGYNHGGCDGRSFQHFMKSWASICQTGDLQINSLPFLDRGIIEDPNDIQTTFLNAWWDSSPSRARTSHGSAHHRPTDQRATFILSKVTIDRLKSWISNRSTILGLEPMNISSFAAACAFTWSCQLKSTSAGGRVLRDHEDKKPQLCHFMFVADCRNYLQETPLPETYFGNCAVPCLVAMEKKVLLGGEGIVLGARAIAEKVKELKNGGAMRMIENSISEIGNVVSQFGRPLGVAGSPRLADYDTDFGWGRPRKSVMVHIDLSGAISLTQSRDEDGGMEIGVVLSKASMDAFTTLFNQLESLII